MFFKIYVKLNIFIDLRKKIFFCNCFYLVYITFLFFALGFRWLRVGFLLGCWGGLWWFVGWFEVGHGGSDWILVDPVIVGGGLRGLFIANKNENNK